MSVTRIKIAAPKWLSSTPTIRSALALTLLMAALMACQQSWEENPQTDIIQMQSPIPFQYDIYEGTHDVAIAAAVYTDKRMPEDFYRNNLPNDDVFYTTVNLKNTDLVPISNRLGMASYELSTDDFSQAMEWSETAAGFRPTYKQLVETSQTELYFQFTRVDLDNPQFVDLFRVFKLSALDRSGIDLVNPNGYLGTITIPDVSSQQVKYIIEYLWTFTFSNNYGTAVLLSKITEYESEFVHTLVEARLQDLMSQSCNTIDIVEITYTVDKATGAIHKHELLIRSIFAEPSFNICEASTV
jgi:hypothetical protein